jgi:hypothetical protein
VKETEDVQGKKLPMSGHGSMTYAGGMKYEGEWKDGRWEGQGTLTYPGGMTYKGEWKNNKMEGHGTVTFPTAPNMSANSETVSTAATEP